MNSEFQKNRGIIYVVALLLSFILTLHTNCSFAESSNYQRIYVGDRVSLEIPKHWRIRDLNERLDISAAAEAVVDSVSENSPIFVSSLAAQSKPEPTGAIVRVSYIPTTMQDEQLEQDDIKVAIKNGLAESIQTLNHFFEQEFDFMEKALKKMGVDVISRGPANIEEINGLVALTYTYRRTSAYGQSPFRVTQYHIPLGTEKVLVTLSYREADELMFLAILNRVKSSLIIH